MTSWYWWKILEGTGKVLCSKYQKAEVHSFIVLKRYNGNCLISHWWKGFVKGVNQSPFATTIVLRNHWTLLSTWAIIFPCKKLKSSSGPIWDPISHCMYKLESTLNENAFILIWHRTVAVLEKKFVLKNIHIPFNWNPRVFSWIVSSWEEIWIYIT